MATATKCTSELRQGDVVNCHGMRCLIDRPLQTASYRPGVHWTQALVLNRDEVSTRAVPFSFTAEWRRDVASSYPRPHDGQHRWTIQGNDLATWAVEA